MTTGFVTQHGPAIRHRGVLVPLPKAQTPAGAWIASIIADIDSGALLPCPHCGGYCGCGCDFWLEAMEAREVDPHGDLSVWLDTDIPL